MVDLERRQPIALLPDRTAAPVAQWLRAHPGVEIIARDRSSAYAEGAREGAPRALQVADRFHLVQNLAEALEEVFTTQHQAFDAVHTARRQQPVPLPDGTTAVPVPPPPTPSRAAQQAAQRAARRQALYDAIWALHHQGQPVAAIAAQVDRDRRTVQHYLRLPTWPAPQHRSTYGRSVLNPYTDYLLERWNAGCRMASQLFREVQAQGYTGSYRRVGFPGVSEKFCTLVCPAPGKGAGTPGSTMLVSLRITGSVYDRNKSCTTRRAGGLMKAPRGGQRRGERA
ncbi:MAG: hypothetical protein AUI36_31945 [Cyanobacteria bacterium 13_1_40CM_2_61_4]|nr:MAG: hypothetical protein AUI36_31945 [Cyanobacteria bacterium 13_1_40CM_2_61_4]